MKVYGASNDGFQRKFIIYFYVFGDCLFLDFYMAHLGCKEINLLAPLVRHNKIFSISN
jgi:hypothetical protein